MAFILSKTPAFFAGLMAAYPLSFVIQNTREEVRSMEAREASQSALKSRGADPVVIMGNYSQGTEQVQMSSTPNASLAERASLGLVAWLKAAWRGNTMRSPVGDEKV